jgi:hypothetical protein
LARLHWEILSTHDSELAKKQKTALEYFYNNLSATHVCDGNELGGISLLVRQMMDAIGKKYAIHEIIFESCKISALEKSFLFPKLERTTPSTLLTATFRFVPL